jgi:lipopolysaccharide transport system permease protein
MESQRTEIVIEPPHKFFFNFRELWQYHELFYFFAWRDVKVKYKQTVLGFLWVVLQPLLMIAVFTFLFSKALKHPESTIDYPVFAFSGLILWNVFSASVINGGNSMVANAQVIKKIYFPRLIIPLSSIIVAFVDFFVSFPVFIVFLILYKTPVNILQIVTCWPLAMLLTILAAIGLGSWLSALTVKYRDFRFIVPFVIQVAFFLTPIIYPVSTIRFPWLNYVLAVNPMYGAISLFRMPLMVEADPVLITISFLSAVIFALVGVIYFKKTELYFADLA